MIHLALVAAAVLFLGWLGIQLLGVVIAGFEEGPGCGCAAIVGVGIVVIVILAIAL